MSSFSSIRTTHNWIRVCTQVLGDCRTTLFNHFSWWSLFGFCFWTGKKSSLTDIRLLEIKYFYVPPLSLLHAFPSKQKMACKEALKIRIHFLIPSFQGPYFLSSICSVVSFDSVGFVHCRPAARVSQKTYVHEHRMRPAKAKIDPGESETWCVFGHMNVYCSRIGFGFWWPGSLTWTPCLASLWWCCRAHDLTSQIHAKLYMTRAYKIRTS